MPAIALLVKESLSWLIKVVTTPRNIKYGLRKGDSVPHQRLQTELESIGIVGEFLKWIRSSLTEGKHNVCVDDQLSTWSYAKSGIPQGSLLGPIVFVIFINHMPNSIKNSCFFLYTKHLREDNPDLYYWTEIMRQHTQTFNI